MKHEFSPGDIVKGYRIIREIGRGAMGIVYEAIQLNLERKVALKILFVDQDGNESLKQSEFISRFFSEARVIAKLNHPNIIQASDAGCEQSQFFYVMEYVDGKNLRDLILEQKRLPLEEVFKIAQELVNALQYSWDKYQLTHGDIKPENIMLDGHGHTKLMDFGLATMRKNNRKHAADIHEHSLIFTPLYAAPEIINATQGNSATMQTDIYALGATLYHLILGEPPFPGTDPDEVMKAHISKPVIPLHSRIDVPQDFSNLISSMLRKNPKVRIASWTLVRHKLIECIQSYEARKLHQTPSSTQADTILHTKSQPNKRKVIFTTKKNKHGHSVVVRKKSILKRAILIFILLGLIISASGALYCHISGKQLPFIKYSPEIMTPKEQVPEPQLHWDETDVN